ncbi:MAG: hypothetical protein AAB368_16895, partial [bacterium]
ADLKVRRASQPGADVALLTARVLRAVAWNGAPLHLECKCVERGWGFDAAFWRGERQRTLEAWWRQAKEGADRIGDRQPVLVLGRNRWPALAAWGYNYKGGCGVPGVEKAGNWEGKTPGAEGGGFVFTTLARLLLLLDGWPERS